MGRSRGINVYEEAWEELTREKAFEGYVPEKVCISLSQDGEAICQPTVLPGEYVSLGQVIGGIGFRGARPVFMRVFPDMWRKSQITRERPGF